MSSTGKCSLYVYDESKWLPAVTKTYFLDEPAKLSLVENAALLPPRYIEGTPQKYGDGILEGGVCDADGCFAAGLKRSHSKNDVNKNCSYAYRIPEDEIEQREEEVIFGGILTSHFGHMLCDGMTRLWYPALNPDDQRKLVFLIYPNQVFNFWDFIDLSGIERSRVEIITKPTRFKSVLIPQETIYSVGTICYRREWLQFLSVIRENVEPSSMQKVYFTRTKLSNSGCIGEEYFESFFAANGYEIISPERLTIREQISIAAGAEEIATTMGTLAHHAMFAGENTHLTILNRSRTVVGAQLAFNQASGVRVSIVDVYKNILPEEQGGGSCFLLAPTTHWDKYLRENIPSGNVRFSQPYDLPKNLHDYIMAWGKRYQAPQGFQWIRDETVPDIVARINRYLRGVEVDTSNYPPTKKMEALELDNERLRAMAPEYALACVTIAADNLELSGTVPIHFVSSDELDLEVVLFPGSKNPLASECTLFECKEGIAWSARIPLLSLGNPPYSYPGSFELGVTAELRIAHDEKIVCLPLKNSYNDTHVRVSTSPLLPARTAVMEGGLLRQSSALFLLAPFSKAVGAYVNYEITSIEWRENILDLAGWVENPLLGEEGMVVSLRLQSESGECISQSLNFVSQDACHCSWDCTVDLIDTFGSLGPTRSRWMYSLVIELDGGEVSVPFGRRRPLGSFARFSSKTVTLGGNLITPVESKNKQLGFYLRPISYEVERNWNPIIRSMQSKDQFLEMTVDANNKLVRQGVATLRFVLLEASGDNGREAVHYPQSFSVEALRDGSDGDLRIIMPYDAFNSIECKKIKSVEFGIEKRIRGVCKIEAFGCRRPKGTLKKFKSVCFPCGENRALIPIENSLSRNLGFKSVSFRELPKESWPIVIGSLRWDETLLTINGSIAPAFSTFGADCVSFAVLSNNESVVFRCPLNLTYDTAKEAWTWDVRFEPTAALGRRLIANSEELYFAMILTNGKQEIIQRFGKQRPVGTLAIFEKGSYRLRKRIVMPCEFGDKTLGFKIEKA